MQVCKLNLLVQVPCRCKMAKLFTCLGSPTQFRQSILNMESKMILSSFMSQAENHKYSIQYLLISKVIYNVIFLTTGNSKTDLYFIGIDFN